MPTENRHQEGFSLTEVIVAFAILTLSLAALLQSFSLGSQSVSRSENVINAMSFARSKMEEIGHTVDLEQGEVSGDYKPLDYGWKVTIDPFDPNEMKVLTWQDGAPTPDTNLYNVLVSVYDQKSGRLLYELETVKLKAPDA